VAFRWYARQQAEQLGLKGYVRNLPDGSVRIVAEGAREALEAFLNWAGHGPAHAHVAFVDSSWTTATGEYDDFLITG
jgi:acylphosphatase